MTVSKSDMASRSMSGFTLTEMLVVVAVIAVVAGTAVVLVSGVSGQSDRQLVHAECAAIRDAVNRFHADMGEAPRLIAELLQSPDPGDRCGGWWWRTTDAPPAAMYRFDPATRRGWRGPYLRSDYLSEIDRHTAERRQAGAATYEQYTASPENGRCLRIMQSQFTSICQAVGGNVSHSHYQLDASDPKALAVCFVVNPLAAPGEICQWVCLNTGVKP